MSGNGTTRNNRSPSGNAASSSASEGASTVQHTSDPLSENNVGPIARQLEPQQTAGQCSVTARGASGDGARRDPSPGTPGEQETAYPNQSTWFRELSRLNGEVNRMPKKQLRKELANFSLNTGGVKEVLQKRLKNFYRREKMSAANIVEMVPYDFLIVIDFEATCRENNEQFVHEIIEFPAVLIDFQRKKIVGMFREFCKPVFNPVLTNFCKHLTGVNQSEVDNASEFPGVLESFQQWLNTRQIRNGSTFCVVTDGPWDIHRFLAKQCQISQVPMPRWSQQWINMRKTYRNFYNTRRLNLDGMLDSQGMQFEGRPHCGLHNSINIARLVCRMLEDGSAMLVNEILDRPQPMVSTSRQVSGDRMAPPQQATSAQGSGASTAAGSQSTPGCDAAVDTDAVL